MTRNRKNSATITAGIAWGQATLLARRLVEVGVTFVTINHFEAEVDWWDDHYTIEKNLHRRLPIYDQALASLIEDLHDRGMADDIGLNGPRTWDGAFGFMS